MMAKPGARWAGRRPALLAGLLMPLLAYCSSGPQAVTATTASTPQAEVVSGRAVIYINEVLAHTDEPQVDAVELYNPNEYAVDLTGWCISDKQDEPQQFCIAAREPRVAIRAGGYQVYTAPSLPFGFSEFGEEVYLYAPGAAGLQLIDHVAFGVSPNGVSLGRYVNSAGQIDFPLQRAVTLGAANAGPLIPPATIGELMYDPARGPEYLVISNSSGAPVPLFDPAAPQNSWRVVGIGNNNGAYTLPAGTVLKPGESIVISADPAEFMAAYPQRTLRVFGPFSGKLNNDGELISLEAPQPPESNGDVTYAVMDMVEYGVVAPWPAVSSGHPLVRVNLNTYGNDPANWRAGGGSAALEPVLMLPLVVR